MKLFAALSFLPKLLSLNCWECDRSGLSINLSCKETTCGVDEQCHYSQVRSMFNSQITDIWWSGCLETSTKNMILTSQLCTPDGWSEFCNTDLCNIKRDWSSWRPPKIDSNTIRYSSPSTTTFDISWDAPESCQKLEYRLVYYPVVNRNDKKEVRNGNNRFVTLLDMQPARQYRLEIYTIAPNYQYESLPYKVVSQTFSIWPSDEKQHKIT